MDTSGGATPGRMGTKMLEFQCLNLDLRLRPSYLGKSCQQMDDMRRLTLKFVNDTKLCQNRTSCGFEVYISGKPLESYG